jgi:hypothetical protein
LGIAANRILAVTLSEVTKVNLAESVPEVMVIVEDSLTVIVATLVDIAVFSAMEKVAEFVKVGAVESAVYVNETEPSLDSV